MLRSFILHHNNGQQFNLLLSENSSDNDTAMLLDENTVPYIRRPNYSHQDSLNLSLPMCNTKYALIVDTDITFSRPITPLYNEFVRNHATLMGEICGDRGGKKLKPRVHPWFCFVNIEDINSRKIKFYDPVRSNVAAPDGKSYDIGATMFEDVKNAGLKVVDYKHICIYFKHYEGMSWQAQHEWFSKRAYRVAHDHLEDTKSLKKVEIINKFVKGYNEEQH
jgi:hypothetical protein